MTLYHRTTKPNAEAILAVGFNDGEGFYGTTMLTSGVFLSDRPLDVNEGARGDVLLEVHLELTNEEIDWYEWKEEGKPYREWQIPASLLNSKATVTRLEEDSPPAPCRRG
jgi:hypothetical protein